MGPPLLRRPLPDAPPWWSRAPKPLCGGAVRARPERWGAAPSGGWPGLVGSVACSAASRRGRWWARVRIGHLGASVGRAYWGQCCTARGSQAGLGHERGEMVGLDYRSEPPQVKSPRHVASPFINSPNHTTFSTHPTSTQPPPQTPISLQPGSPKSAKFQKSPRCARCSAKAHILPSRLCVATHSAIKGVIKEPLSATGGQCQDNNITTTSPWG